MVSEFVSTIGETSGIGCNGGALLEKMDIEEPLSMTIPWHKTDRTSVYNKFFAEFDKSVADETSKEYFATKFNSIVGKYDFVNLYYLNIIIKD